MYNADRLFPQRHAVSSCTDWDCDTRPPGSRVYASFPSSSLESVDISSPHHGFAGYSVCLDGPSVGLHRDSGRFPSLEEDGESLFLQKRGLREICVTSASLHDGPSEPWAFKPAALEDHGFSVSVRPRADVRKVHHLTLEVEKELK